jgi:hypothetical protein
MNDIGSKFEGWSTQIEVNGEDLPAKEGEGFDFVY